METVETLVSLLTSPPILALLDTGTNLSDYNGLGGSYRRNTHWNKPFRLHTDASETGAGAILRQIQGMAEKTLACASHRWSKPDEKTSPTDRKCLAVLLAIDKFTSYLQARPFIPIADCSALTWLFKSQALSASFTDGHFGFCSTTWSSSGDREPNTSLLMRYHAHMAMKPEEALSTTPSQVTARRKGPTVRDSA